jgi:hypothetical protein
MRESIEWIKSMQIPTVPNIDADMQTQGVTASCISAVSQKFKSRNEGRTTQHRGSVVCPVGAVLLMQMVGEASHEGQLDLLLHVLEPRVHDGGWEGHGDESG